MSMWVGTYINTGYNAPRSYICQCAVEFDAAISVVISLGEIVIVYPPDGLLIVPFHEGWYDWNSNVYSIEYVFDMENSQNYPHFPGPQGAWYSQNLYQHIEGKLTPTLRVAFSPETPRLLELPGAPADYWLSDPCANEPT